MDFRSKFDSWAKRTVREMINGCVAPDEDKAKLISLCEKYQPVEFLNRKVDGKFMNKMFICEVENFGVSFSAVFRKTVEQGNFNPMQYALNLLHAFNKLHLAAQPKTVAGLIGRGLRCVPSYIREADLKDRLASVIPNATIEEPSVEEDLDKHTDLFLKVNGRKYRIWSYQMTTNGLKNVASKLSGDRGLLTSGLHLLLPFDMKNEVDCQNVNEWYLYNDEYFLDVKDRIDSGEIDDYRDIYYDEFIEYAKDINIFRV